MKKLKTISLLLVICLSILFLNGCNKQEEQKWIHTTQYYNYLNIENHPEYSIEMRVDEITKGTTRINSCYDGNFLTKIKHIEFKINISNNAPTNYVNKGLDLDNIYFKFNNDLIVHKMFLYINDYTEDYGSITIRTGSYYQIYLRILYSGNEYNGTQRIEGIEDDYILKLWNVRI